MNSTQISAFGSHLTCWQIVIHGVEEESRGSVQTAVFVVLCVISFFSVLFSGWCAVVTFSTQKLRQPTWIIKASMAVKDVIFTIAVVMYSAWNITVNTDVIEKLTFHSQGESYFNPVEFIFTVVLLLCISSSFTHLLLLTFDRHQVISRPFRYHTGELLPTKVASVLIASGWTFCFVIGLGVTSQTLEDAERRKRLAYSGVLYPFYHLPALQLWFFCGGMMMVYVLTLTLLIVSSSIEANRAKTRKERLLSGVGDPEPLRSRDNSVCHVTGKRTVISGVHHDSRPDSEADADEFLLSAGGFGVDSADRCSCEEVTIFTPVHYRPSLLRRIRDTWSLYSASICFVAFSLLGVIPFLVLTFTSTSEISTGEGSEVSPVSLCVGLTVIEHLMLLQGICYVSIYVIIDDVFRPHFMKPFKYLHCKLLGNGIDVYGSRANSNGKRANRSSSQLIDATRLRDRA